MSGTFVVPQRNLVRFYCEIFATMKILKNLAIEHHWKFLKSINRTITAVYLICVCMWYYIGFCERCIRQIIIKAIHTLKSFKSKVSKVLLLPLLIFQYKYVYIYMYILLLMLYISSLYLAFFPLIFYDCFVMSLNIVCLKTSHVKGKVVKAVWICWFDTCFLLEETNFLQLSVLIVVSSLVMKLNHSNYVLKIT